MREIIIITVSIVFVIIMYPIVFPDRSVILYVRDLSEKNAGHTFIQLVRIQNQFDIIAATQFKQYLISVFLSERKE